MDSNVLLPAFVAVIVALMVPGIAYLGVRHSSKVSSSEKAHEAERAERAEFRQEQAREYASLKLEHRTLSDTHRDIVMRLDANERKCIGLEEDLQEQHDIVSRIMRENVGLSERVKSLEVQLLAAYDDNSRLRRRGDSGNETPV